MSEGAHHVDWHASYESGTQAGDENFGTTVVVGGPETRTKGCIRMRT